MFSLDSPKGVEDHGEEDELAQERNHQGGGGDDLGQQEEEHGEGEEDANWKTDLKFLLLFFPLFLI